MSGLTLEDGSPMRIITFITSLVFSVPALALSSAGYLPADANLDPAIPTPESVLGWEVGEWRASHDQIARYMEILAASSDRVSISTVGFSHEQRPILQLIFTSTDNHGRLEELRNRHLASATGNLDPDSPLVVWLGHSIHGNEESGANGGLLSAYYLAASRSDFVHNLLAETIIIFDPAFNPDGLNRFASWSNSNRSMNPVANPDHRINNEAWPSGRTNHYLFDINRDWLPLVHPESRARVAQFHRWLPHVLTDQHERARDGYFFQPGIPSRQNPLTPPENLDMTRALAQYTASAFDRDGETYFTEDDYDDFYFGKGSSYPDINGSIGILYEQPAMRGPVLDRDTGRITFVGAIRNHLRSTFSVLKGGHEMRDRLKAYQNGFFKTLAERADGAGFAAWIVGDDGDPARARAFLDVLDQHQVTYREVAEVVRSNGRMFMPGRAWAIPVRQRQFGMAQALMDSRTEFEDETFYDVSAWTQPLAYNLPYARVSRMPRTRDAAPVTSESPDRDANAWIVPWNQLAAPALLQRLLTAGVRIQAATSPFNTENRSFDRGALVIIAGLQDDRATAEAAFLILEQGTRDGIIVENTSTSLTPQGPDLGASTHFKVIKPVRPLMVVGDGINTSDAGEAWHHFDLRIGVVPVMVEMSRLGRIRLSEYTHLILPDGLYSAINDSLKKRIVQWVMEGGTIISMVGGSSWAETLCFSATPDACQDDSKKEDAGEVEDRAYADYGNDSAQRLIGGAIVSTRVDLTHPLAYGYQREELPVFKRGTNLLKPSDNAYSTPVRISDSPLMAGFIGEERQAEMAGQPAVIAERQGAGLVVRFAYQPLFRGFWRGTERLFENALYMGQVIQSTEISD